jgi:hypothetical protein
MKKYNDIMKINTVILALCKTLEKDFYIGKNKDDHSMDAARYCMDGISKQVDIHMKLINLLYKLGVRVQS